jgi:molybdopterin/thiamine biosynthesis adenylyltransferase
MIITGRFSDALWHDLIQELRVTVIGCGGIGSWSALLLGRVHPLLIELVDDDLFDDSNLAGQFVRDSDVGKSKVMALSQYLKDFSDYESVIPYKARLSKSNFTSFPHVICGLDSMLSRRECFEGWLSLHRGNGFFIDGRLGAERWELYFVDGSDDWSICKYRDECLPSDADVPDAVCSYKQTSHFAAMLGGMIVSRVCSWVSRGTGLPVEIPFVEKFDGRMLTREVYNGQG